MHPECLPPPGRQVLAQMKDLLAAHGLILAGGTALALQIGHRFSEDLDFFTPRSFSTDEIFRRLQSKGLAPVVMQEEGGTLILLAGGVKVSFMYYPYPFTHPQPLFQGVPLALTVDIAAMKIIAICQRGAKRDFIDLYFILRTIPFRLIAENMLARFGRERINPIHVGKSLVWFNDAETDPPPRYCRPGPAWEKVRRFFMANVKQMVLDLHRAGEEK